MWNSAPVVIEILPWKYFVDNSRGVHVCKEMLPDIPSSITEIQAANVREMIVDDDEFLMVGPIEGHVAKVLKDIVVGMTENMDVTMARCPLRTKGSQGMLGMSRIAGQGLLNLLVDDDIDLDSTLGGTLDDLVEPPFLIEKGRAAQKQLRGEPPVGDVNGLFGIFQADRDRPHVVTTIDVPLDLVVFAFGEEGLETMVLANGAPLAIGFLLMLLVVAMVSVDQVLEFANLVLEMDSFDFGVVQLGIYRGLFACGGWVRQ